MTLWKFGGFDDCVTPAIAKWGHSLIIKGILSWKFEREYKDNPTTWIIHLKMMVEPWKWIPFSQRGVQKVLAYPWWVSIRRVRTTGERREQLEDRFQAVDGIKRVSEPGGSLKSSCILYETKGKENVGRLGWRTKRVKVFSSDPMLVCGLTSLEGMS